MKTKHEFMQFYENTVDDVFSYYYSRTGNHNTSLDLTKRTFEKTWDEVSRGMPVSLIGNKSVDRELPKSAPDLGHKSHTSSFGFIRRKLGY